MELQGFILYLLYISWFTEHDTFRSNQVREGGYLEIKLRVSRNENRPRYENIAEYLEMLARF